jgi:hypothetical protein
MVEYLYAGIVTTALFPSYTLMIVSFQVHQHLRYVDRFEVRLHCPILPQSQSHPLFYPSRLLFLDSTYVQLCYQTP